MPIFLERYPALTLDLDLDDRRVDIIRDGFDVVLRGGHALDDNRLIARRIANLPYAICASPDYLTRNGYPERPEDIARHELVQYSLAERSQPWTCELGGERIVVPVAARYAVNSSLAVRDALIAGLGVGRIPELYVRDEVKRGQLVQLLPDWSKGSFDLFAVHPSRRHVPPKVSAFVDLLQEGFRTIGDH